MKNLIQFNEFDGRHNYLLKRRPRELNWSNRGGYEVRSRDTHQEGRGCWPRLVVFLKIVYSAFHVQDIQDDFLLYIGSK